MHHYKLQPHHSVQDQLSEEMVEKVKWQVNRESAEDKVRDFLEWMKAIKGIVNHLVSSAFVCSLYIIMYIMLEADCTD